MSKLIIVRGLPGSGKSTFAKKYFSYPDFLHYEADQFFTAPDGTYHYNKAEINKAHEWCYAQVFNTLINGRFNVCVSNTFTRLEFIKRYLDIRKQEDCNDISAEIHEMLGTYGSIHNVPEADMKKMKKAWQEIPTHWGIQVTKHY